MFVARSRACAGRGVRVAGDLLHAPAGRDATDHLRRARRYLAGDAAGPSRSCCSERGGSQDVRVRAQLTRPDAGPARPTRQRARRVRDPVRPRPLRGLRGDPVPDRDRRRGRPAAADHGRSSSTAGWSSGSSGSAPEAWRPRRRAGRRDRERRLCAARSRRRSSGRSASCAPPRAQRWRALYCELERIACHLDVIAKEAETTALYVGQARFQILKEQAQRLRAQADRQSLRPRRDRPRRRAQRGLARHSTRPAAALDALERDLRARPTAVPRYGLDDRPADRRRAAAARAGRGATARSAPVARGSGVSTDARHERPYGDYERLGLRVVHPPRGRRDGASQRPLRRARSSRCG